MIKILFTKTNFKNIDIEKEFNIKQDLEIYIENLIKEIKFDSMDYPYDSEYNYVLYFKSNNEIYNCKKLFKLLKNLKKNSNNLEIKIYTYNNFEEEEKLIYIL